MTLTAIKERPILFSGPMVRAILEGRKTETRRIIKAPSWSDGIENLEIDCDGEPLFICKTTGCQSVLECPYGNVGDRLWVRETWAVSAAYDSYKPSVLTPHVGEVGYAAGGGYDFERGTERGKWRPSIFMPRWASRITLEIAGRRVERLQAMRHNAAVFKAEGFELPTSELFPDQNTASKLERHFTELWDKINPDEKWSSNPWVRVVQFKRINPTTEADSDIAST